MITWIQRTFQHHFKTVFMVLLGLIIVSFVFFTSGAAGGDPSRRTGLKREFFGYNLGSPDDQQRLMGDAGLSANLQVGYGLEAEQVQNYAFQRAATLHLANELKIPASTVTEIADQIKTLRAFAGQDGQFDANAYKTFRDNLKSNPRLTEADIARVIGDDVRADKVQKLLGGPGYVLPSDVKNQLARADTTWTLGTATVDYTTFNPAVTPSDAELTKFFEESSFRYEIPPRMVVSFADFPGGDYLAQVKVTDAEVRAYYDANPSRFPKPAADAKAAAPAKVDPAADFAAVSNQVEAALKAERAQRLAAKAASDFVFSLYEAKAVAGSPALANATAALKHPVKALAPFTRESGPAEFGAAAPAAAEEAFKLSKDRAYSEAVATTNGAAVLFWQDTQPARKPAFAEVRAKVSADYLENEKRKRFVELGRTLRSLIENRLKAGDTFEKAATAAATGTSAKIEAKAIPAFTLRNRPQDLDYTVFGALERLEKGQVSDLAIAADKGTFVYVSDKKVPDFSATNPLYAETRTQLGTYTARLGSSAYLGELVERELKRSEPVVK